MADNRVRISVPTHSGYRVECFGCTHTEAFEDNPKQVNGAKASSAASFHAMKFGHRTKVVYIVTIQYVPSGLKQRA